MCGVELGLSVLGYLASSITERLQPALTLSSLLRMRQDIALAMIDSEKHHHWINDTRTNWRRFRTEQSE